MKQDRRRYVVVMDRSKYTEKCLHTFQTQHFTELRHDPTKSVKNKIYQELRKLKTIFRLCKITPAPYFWHYRRASH